MKITLAPSERDVNIKRIHCPECGERLRNVGLPEGCRIEGMTFRCKRCRGYFKVDASEQRSV